MATQCEACFLAYVNSEGQDLSASVQSDQSSRCPLTESLVTIECINGEQMHG